MWSNNSQQELNMLDIITILSFVLQLQNQEAHQVERLRNELTREMQQGVEARLDKIEKQLNELTYLMKAQY